MEIINAQPELKEESSVCSFALPRNELTPGLNTLPLRVNVSYRDLLSTEQQPLLTKCSRRGLDETADRLRRPIIAQFTRLLTPITIQLYEEYPEDIPHEIDPNTQRLASDGWFNPVGLRVVQVRLPERENSRSRFSVVGDTWGGRFATVGVDCAPAEPPPLAGVIIGMELNGRFMVVPPVSIASHFEWRPRNSSAALISFPLIIGGGVFGLGSMLEPVRITTDGVFSSLKRPGSKELSVYLEPARGLSFTRANREFTTGLLEFRESIPLPHLLPDQTEPGVLDLRPARDLALTNYFGRYLGHRDWAVPLDVRTLQGRWMDGPPCTPRPGK